MSDRKAYMKIYREKNKEYRKEYDKKWRKKNREYLNGCAKKYREENPERYMGCQNKYKKTEKGKATNQRGNFKRRAKYKEVINNLTAEEWLNILRQYNFKCAYCGKDLFDLFIKPERDHVIPISKGGNNIKENIVPTCHSCNAKKSDKIIILEEITR